MSAHASSKTNRLAQGLLAGLLLPISLQAAPQASGDWLIDPSPFVAKVTPNRDGSEIELANGLVRRVIRLQPNAATVVFDNLMTGESLLRSVRPEASVTLDGVSYEVGGLTGPPVHNYFAADWTPKLQANPRAFRFTGFKIGRTQARFPWKQRRE